jgi:lipopolysaccharide biosynthesis regulator YciM
MPGKKNYFNVEISDIIEPEQENLVIETVKDYVKKDHEALKSYFESTDTIEIKRLSEEEARKLAEQLKGSDIVVRLVNVHEKHKEREAAEIKCPRCGHVIEFADWRCPECYFEFSDYEFKGDEENQNEE